MKDIDNTRITVTIDKYDENKKELRLRYFFTNKIDENIYLDNTLVSPRYTKIRSINGTSEHAFEKIIWIRVERLKAVLSISLANKVVNFSIYKQMFDNLLLVSKIIRILTDKSVDHTKIPLRHKLYRFIYQRNYFYKKFHNAWILVDRDYQADDNAEHLYRYMMRNEPKIKIYFLLKKSSHDWLRLKKEGFNLLSIGSYMHKAALIHASHLVSSHTFQYDHGYLRPKYYSDLVTRKFTFLRHGVTKDNLADLLNPIEIDCFVTSAQREYDSICNDKTNYTFTKKEVVLTGFARHDALLQTKKSSEKIILIMPTWRRNIVIASMDKSNHTFAQTTYCQKWKSLLHSQRLLEISKKNNYRIIFFPHALVQPSIDEFQVPEHVEALSHSFGSIQSLFQKATVLITDYSSVFFEMGMLNKQTFYYQFDQTEFFSGGHCYSKGYFSYEEDGFGPVSLEENDLLDKLEGLLTSNRTIEQIYLDRIQNFFAFHDTDNSKRIVNAICDLEAS